MTPSQLRPVIASYGGTRNFAAAMRVSQRVVQYWLAGKRRIRPVIEDRIRLLKPPTKK